VWGHKQKAKELREDLRSHISLYYGPSAWEEIVRLEGEMRKKRTKEVYAKEEQKQMIFEWIIGLIAAAIGGSILVLIFWLIGVSTGKW
jgi:hypothetical protein